MGYDVGSIVMNNNQIAGIIVLLIAGIAVFFSVTQQTVFELQPQTIVEYVTPASCEVERFVCNHPYELSASGGSVMVNGYEISTRLESFGFEKKCLNNPPLSHNGDLPVKSFVDSDGCQHWNYVIEDARECCLPKTGSQNMCCNEKHPSVCGVDVPTTAPNCDSRGWTYEHQVLGLLTEDYGGLVSVEGSDRFGCWSAVTIRNDGELLYSDREFSDGSRDLTFHSSGSDVRTFTFDDLTVRVGASAVGNSRGCSLFTNHYFFEPVSTDDLSFEVSLPSDVLQGDDIVTEITVDNRNSKLFGELIVDYEAPSIIGGVTRTDKRMVTVPEGVSKFNFTLEGRFITEELMVTPRLVLLLDSDKFSGVNVPKIDDGLLVSVDKVDFYLVGEVRGDTALINVESLADRVVSLRLETEELQSLVDGNIRRINELRGDRSQQRALIDDLIMQIDELNATASESLIIIDRLQLSVVEKQERVVQLTNLLDEQSDKIALLQRLSSDLQRDYESAKSLILQLRDNLNSADDRVSFLLLTVEELQLSNSEVNDLISSYESTIEEDSLLIAELRNRNYELSSLLEGLDPERVSSIVERVSELEREIAFKDKIISFLSVSGVLLLLVLLSVGLLWIYWSGNE